MTRRRPIALLGVPSSAGAYAPGQEKAPAALRAAGLVQRLEATGAEVLDRGDSAVWRWRPDREDRSAQNLGAVVDTVRETAARVSGAASDGLLPVVLGGDCTVGVGTVTGLAGGTGRLGLVYFDMHPDLNIPSSVPDGALDWMGLAHMLGVPGARPDLAPLLEPDEVVLLGYRRDRCTPHELGAIDELSLDAIELANLESDPEGLAAAAVSLLAGRCDRIAVHFDVDVIDFTDAPLSEEPGRNIGLSFDAAMRALAVLVASERLAALTITELNPDHGEADGSTLVRFVDGLARAFAGSLSTA